MIEKNARKIFNFLDYKEYLVDAIQHMPGNGRGVRRSLSDSIRCKTSYVTQVLNGNAHFSLEQGILVNQFFSHNPLESHYFLLLIQFLRAGSESLKLYFRDLLDKCRDESLNLSKRLPKSQTLSATDQQVYYSDWTYAAVHVLLSIPRYRTAERLAKALSLKTEVVNKILTHLDNVGLAKRVEGEFQIGTARLHLGSDSPLIAKHHTNWRVHSIQAINKSYGDLDHLHYSSVVTLSASDVRKVKARIVEVIEELKLVIQKSEEETCFSLGMDFYPITGN